MTTRMPNTSRKFARLRPSRKIFFIDENRDLRRAEMVRTEFNAACKVAEMLLLLLLVTLLLFLSFVVALPLLFSATLFA